MSVNVGCGNYLPQIGFVPYGGMPREVLGKESEEILSIANKEVAQVSLILR